MGIPACMSAGLWEAPPSGGCGVPHSEIALRRDGRLIQHDPMYGDGDRPVLVAVPWIDQWVRLSNENSVRPDHSHPICIRHPARESGGGFHRRTPRSGLHKIYAPVFSGVFHAPERLGSVLAMAPSRTEQDHPTISPKAVSRLLPPNVSFEQGTTPGTKFISIAPGPALHHVPALPGSRMRTTCPASWITLV